MSAAGEKIVLVGGSFDPVHHAHLICARAVAEAVGVKRVVLVPAAQPPHKKGTAASAADRLAMLRLAVEGDDLFEVDDLELRRGGASYTYDTLAAIRAGRGGARLFWVIGADMLRDLHLWHRVNEVLEMAELLVMVRPPWDREMDQTFAALARRLGSDVAERLRRHVVPTPLVDISSTEIRRRIAAGLSIRYLVSEGVRDYIRRRGLYSQSKLTISPIDGF